MIVTALASPITYEQKSPNNKKGRDLVLALDSSAQWVRVVLMQKKKNCESLM